MSSCDTSTRTVVSRPAHHVARPAGPCAGSARAGPAPRPARTRRRRGCTIVSSPARSRATASSARTVFISSLRDLARTRSTASSACARPRAGASAPRARGCAAAGAGPRSRSAAGRAAPPSPAAVATRRTKPSVPARITASSGAQMTPCGGAPQGERHREQQQYRCQSSACAHDHGAVAPPLQLGAGGDVGEPLAERHHDRAGDHPDARAARRRRSTRWR